MIVIMNNKRGILPEDKNGLVFSLLNKPLFCLFAMVINTSLWNMCDNKFDDLRAKIHHCLAVVLLNASSPVGFFSQ